MRGAVRPTALATLLLLALAAGARADDGEGEDAGGVRLSAGLHARFTDLRNAPGTAVPFDPVRSAFVTGGYLRPAGSDTYPSGLVTAGAEGRHGRWSWALQADTGELRSQSFAAPLDVCFATLATTPSGVALRGGGRCNALVNDRLPVFSLDGTRPGAPQLTSNGRPFEDEASSTLLLRQAWVGAALGPNDFALVRAGRKRFTVADGFVYDDWATGAEATFDLGALGPSWELGVSAFYPSRDLPSDGRLGSALVAVRADFLPSLFEHVGVFAAWFRDRSGQVAELFRGTVTEPSVMRLASLTPGTQAYANESRLLVLQLDRAFTGDADVGWAGTSGSVALGRARLDFTGALCFGQLTVPTVDLAELTAATFRTGVAYHARAILGELAHLRLGVPLGEAWRVGGFFVFLSGDDPPLEKARRGDTGPFGGFLGVSPFVTDTNIFFNGGVADSFAARQATAPGVNARGVVAPGVTLGWQPARGFGVDARAAYLVAPSRGPFGGRVYGPEADLELSWSPAPWLTLLAEGDALFPGDFFAGRATVTKVVAGADVATF